MIMGMNWDAAAQTAQNLASQWPASEPGGVIVGFDKTGIVFSFAGGVESLATHKPFTENSVVRFASVTKHVFVSMVLAHSDKIALDDRLGKHLPELKAPLSDVTVGQALDMSGGLPDSRECLTLLGLSIYTETMNDRLMEFHSTMERLNFDAGTQVSYSNTGYRLVEIALERLGLRFDDYLQTQVVPALGVQLKAPDVWNDPVDGLVPGYWFNGSKWQLSAAGLYISAAGSLTGSGTALATWAQALMTGKGTLAGVIEKLSAPRKLADGRMSDYGLGFVNSELDGLKLVGHGGSHPGYKSYVLISPELQCGFVVVANRDDANGGKIAQVAMAALADLQLPQPASTLADGLYVTETGHDWVEIKGATVNYLDNEDALYPEADGWFSSRSATSPIVLRQSGDALEGELGHAPRRLLPVTAKPAGKALDGFWKSPYGAVFDIIDGAVVMGIGPIRQTMPLSDLGGGRYLFTLHDGPWTKRVCLHVLGENRIELVLSRSRMLEYYR
ncbi:serine hydrolase domain-containing protein [Pseudochrobactrum sp. MP213Fo]|uniref:serine hydrolase domain-containing protein n=1 Tax=Pseudochrobactrum sp. MP213Fo TaxID=3022250 RepID=UPI003BA385C6